ncbi:MAG: hypothetical protein EA353_13650 [Puniceicoccaceae bacterium]|nr:MAG: hypothetical protein EA353_13650 [Puniceicoccaceae bacterium]
MSLDPGGDLEVIGGSAALQADFDAGTLGGTMQQEILVGAGGTLSIQNGTISGVDIVGDVTGDLNDPGGSGNISVDTSLDGFIANAGVQGTMTGSATRGGETVGAQGVLAATQD